MIWIGSGDALREPAVSALPAVNDPDAKVTVSPMTAWEIAMLTAKGRLTFSLEPGVWFHRFCSLPGVELAEMPPAVLMASCALPGSPPADPVDRILAATARAFGYTLVTRDRFLLDYGNQGHMRVLAC